MIEEFLSKDNKFAVLGASTDKSKWGYKVYKTLKDRGYTVYPVNPHCTELDGEKCYPDLSSVPKASVVVTVVPPKVTEQIVSECFKLGIRRIWMQPGSESERAVEFCKEHGIECIHSICIIVEGEK